MLKQGADRRRDILKFVKTFRRKHEYGPTITEIAKAVGLGSANATRHHLLKLKDEGLISMEPRIARSIAVATPKVKGKPTAKKSTAKPRATEKDLAKAS